MRKFFSFIGKVVFGTVKFIASVINDVAVVAGVVPRIAMGFVGTMTGAVVQRTATDAPGVTYLIAAAATYALGAPSAASILLLLGALSLYSQIAVFIANDMAINDENVEVPREPMVADLGTHAVIIG